MTTKYWNDLRLLKEALRICEGSRYEAIQLVRRTAGMADLLDSYCADANDCSGNQLFDNLMGILNPPIQVGSYVRLKSGGPDLEVMGISEEGARCEWGEKDNRQSTILPLVCVYGVRKED